MCRTYLDGNVHLGKVCHNPVDDSLDIVFAKVLGDGLHFEQVSIFVGNETVLRKVPGEDVGNTCAQLLLLLGKITPLSFCEWTWKD